MILTLEVIGQQAQQLGSAGKKIFRAVGGTIGRLADNDWVIPDPYVSGRHALIRYLNGKFFVEDTSTNGVYINSQDNRLRRSEPHPLKTGDRLFIDAYEIKVSIASEKPDADGRGAGDVLARRLMGQPAIPGMAPARAPSPPPAAKPARPAPPAARLEEPQDRTAQMDRSHLAHDDGATDFEMIDPLEDDADFESKDDEQRTQYFAFDGSDAQPDDQATRYQPPSADELARQRPLPPDSASRSAVPPRTTREISRSVPPPPPREVPPPPKVVGRDLPGVHRFPASAPPPASAPLAAQAKPSTDAEASFRALLAAAGVRGVEPSVALGQQLGDIVRIVVDGVMEVLRTRERFKDEFRVRATTFKPAHNNPLKFSVNVEDALHNLLIKQNSAYLTPHEAFEDAFRDVRFHEMSIVAGMRAAFESMLNDFDPARLQEEFDKGAKKGALLGVPAKLRYWDQFRDFYAQLDQNTDASFRRLFGEEFSKAYEERLEQFRAQDPHGGK